VSDKTGIEWTDATWNPVTGCTKVSPGCDNCYAETFAERWRGTPGHYFEGGFDVQLRPAKLDLPLRWQRPRRIFVNSMSDLFHAEVSVDFIADVFAVMALATQHTFQLLTKRHARMRSLLGSVDFERKVAQATTKYRKWGPSSWEATWQWPLPNLWLGVSVENQQWADVRVPALLDTPAAVHWLSCEPLLGPVDLTSIKDQYPNALWDYDAPGTTSLGWVVAGGESGRGVRPMHSDWVRALRDQCAEFAVPFLFKQWGSWVPYEMDTQPPFWNGQDGCVVDGHTLPADLSDCEPTHGWWAPDLESDVIYRHVSKKADFRTLDGRTWDEYPTAVPA
jgi:protein gp37